MLQESCQRRSSDQNIDYESLFCFVLFYLVGLQVQVGITLGDMRFPEQKKIYNCANMSGPPTSAL